MILFVSLLSCHSRAEPGQLFKIERAAFITRRPQEMLLEHLGPLSELFPLAFGKLAPNVFSISLHV